MTRKIRHAYARVPVRDLESQQSTRQQKIQRRAISIIMTLGVVGLIVGAVSWATVGSGKHKGKYPTLGEEMKELGSFVKNSSRALGAAIKKLFINLGRSHQGVGTLYGEPKRKNKGLGVCPAGGGFVLVKPELAASDEGVICLTSGQILAVSMGDRLMCPLSTKQLEAVSDFFCGRLDPRCLREPKFKEIFDPSICKNVESTAGVVHQLR